MQNLSNHQQYNGDMIMNMIIATTLSSCISIFSQNIPVLINKIIYFVNKIISLVCYYFFRKTKIEVIGTIKNKDGIVEIKFPIEYYAIIEKIKNSKNLEEIKYTKNMEKYLVCANNILPQNEEREFYIDQYFKTHLENNNICIEFFEPSENQQTILISSKKYKKMELQKIIQDYVNEYTNMYNKIVITNKIIESPVIKLKSPNEYFAVMKHILEKNITFKHIKYTDYSDKNDMYDENFVAIKNILKFYINKYTKVYYDDNLIIEFMEPINIQKTENIDENSSNNKTIQNQKRDVNEMKIVSQEIIISSKKYSVEKIRSIITEWTNEFMKINENINSVTITASVSEEYWNDTQFPIEYRAIISRLEKNKENLHNISYVPEPIPWWQKDLEKNDANKYKYYINHYKKFMVAKDVYVEFLEKKEESDIEKTTKDKKFYQIVVSSLIYSTFELRKIINEWVSSFYKDLKTYNDDDGTKYYYSLDKIYFKPITQSTNDEKKDEKKTENKNRLVWEKNILTSFKSFNNIFFTDKDILLKKLNHFLNNEEWYQKKGIPYNIGFLFHGTPGCGKTSCIKAISNFTNRHVVEINLSKIKKCRDFVKIFNHDYMNDDYIPHNKKIIILEDIDCMIDIVKSRKNAEKCNDNENNNNDNNKEIDIKENDNDMIKMIKLQEKAKIMELEHLEKIEKKKEEERDDDKLTLSCILNTIDGVLENYGRILIITTNHVEKLDSALIRPGRIDMKVNFTKCSKNMYYDIIENYFEAKLDNNIPFIEYKHSPAEVLEICSLHNDDIKKSIEILTKNEDKFEIM
jgi:hypothetical protein